MAPRSEEAHVQILLDRARIGPGASRLALTDQIAR
jgi:hypothetical protein